MSDKAADQQLVERVQKGDKRAFDLLVIKYQQRIMNVISRFVNDFALPGLPCNVVAVQAVSTSCLAEPGMSLRDRRRCTV